MSEIPDMIRAYPERPEGGRHPTALPEMPLGAADTQLYRFAHDLQQMVAEKEAAYQQLYKFVQDLQSLLAERNLALQAATTAQQAKSQLLSNMSHEFRTPLTVVIGFSELLMRETDTAETRDALQRILQASRKLGALVDNLLTVARHHDQPVTGNETVVDLANWLAQLVRSHAASASAKGLGFRLVAPATPTGPVLTDPARLGRALVQLMDNAVKFTESGEVRVSWLAGEATHGAVQIWVEDTGIGIEPAALEQVFEPFSREDGSDCRRHGGAGLGLTIAKVLVDSLGGSLSVDSRKGQGTRVRVELPASAQMKQAKKIS